MEIKLNPLDKKLIELFQEAEKDILLKFIQAVKEGKSTATFRKTILVDIQNILQTLGMNTDAWMNIRIPLSYLEGINEIEKKKEILDFIKQQEKQPSVEEITTFISTHFGQIHLEAVRNLIIETGNYFSDALQGVERGTKWSLAEMYKKEILEKIAKREISGDALQEIKQELIDYFKSKGIVIFRDKAGKSWDLARYSELLVRTETAKASNQGALNRGLEVGITKYKIVGQLDACSICQAHIGKIVEIKNNPELPIYHPHCRCHIIPIF